jgi:cadmium resistance protein CadD (predicted permease)
MDSASLEIVLAGIVFAATDLDDLLILIAFFADPRLRASQVVAGQYLGIAALFAASFVVALAALAVPTAYVGLLGFVPIALGLKELWELREGEEHDEPRGRAVGGAIGVASVTIANGGDNIGVYVPLFATREIYEIAIFAAVFAVMTGLWCWAAHRLVSHPAAGAPIRRYAHLGVPFVLIGLGVFILYEVGSYRLLG